MGRATLTRANGVRTDYSFDYAGRLTGLAHVAANPLSTSQQSFAYSPSGQTIAQAQGNAAFVWFEGPTPGQANTDTRYLHTDRQGSVIGWSNPGGVITPYTYGPYGEPQTWAGSRFR